MKRNKIDKPEFEQVALPQQGNPRRRAALEALQPTGQRKRRFDAQSLEEYAILAAKRFTDEEICAKMNWPFSTFRRWKSRVQNSEKLSNLVIRARQAKLQAHLDNIEEASKGEGAHARADWRASAHIMEVMDRARFGRGESNQNVTTNNTAIVIAAGGEEQLSKLIGSWTNAARPKPTIDCPEVKQIEPEKGD
jgi:hypothetical protein